MEQEQCLELKMLFLLGYNLEIVIVGGELTFGGGGRKTWWGRVYWGKNFSEEGNEQVFGLAGGENSTIPPVGKTLPSFLNIFFFKVVKTNTKKERLEKSKKERLLLLIPKIRYKVFQELNISNVSTTFLIDCQCYTFLFMNIIILDIFIQP